MKITDEARLIWTPGALSGEAVEKAKEARRMRAHAQRSQAYQAWRRAAENETDDGGTPQPDEDDTPIATPRADNTRRGARIMSTSGETEDP